MKNHVDLDSLNLKEILATFEFDGAEVGEDCIRKEEGYEIYRQPGHLGLFLCFNQGYHEGNVFTGVITKSGKPVALGSDSTLEFVESLFDAPTVEKWFDGVEHHMEFRRGEVMFEFSWVQDERGLALVLLILESLAVKPAPQTN